MSKRVSESEEGEIRSGEEVEAAAAGVAEEGGAQPQEQVAGDAGPSSVGAEATAGAEAANEGEKNNARYNKTLQAVLVKIHSFSCHSPFTPSPTRSC